MVIMIERKRGVTGCYSVYSTHKFIISALKLLPEIGSSKEVVQIDDRFYFNFTFNLKIL